MNTVISNLSPKTSRVFELVRMYPGQNSQYYQDLCDKEDGRKTLAVNSTMSWLFKYGYVTREGAGTAHSPFSYTVSDQPIKAKAPTNRRVGGTNLEVVFNLTLPSGKLLQLTREEAKSIYNALSGIL